MAHIAAIVLILGLCLPQTLLAGVVLQAGEIDSSKVKVGAYAEVIYGTGERDQVSGKWKKLNTAQGYIKAVDRESLTIGRGLWKEQIAFERIQKLIMAASGREIDRLKEATDTLSVIDNRRQGQNSTGGGRIVKKLAGGVLGGILVGIAGGMTSMVIGDCPEAVLFCELENFFIGGWYGYVVGLPIGLNRIDPHDQFIYSLSGSLIGGAASLALTDSKDEFWTLNYLPSRWYCNYVRVVPQTARESSCLHRSTAWSQRQSISDCNASILSTCQLLKKMTIQSVFLIIHPYFCTCFCPILDTGPVTEADSDMHITIIGGGIAGLATAFYLKKRAREQGREIQYVLLERSDRWGGMIATESVDGFLIEGGPDLLLTQKPAGIQLCEDLGLTDRLISTNNDRQRTFLVRDGKLVAFPEDFSLVPARFWSLMTSPLYSFSGKVRMGLEVFVPRRRDEGDESLASFIRRRLGREAVNIGGAMLAGIHSADAERLSMQCAFPMYVAMEQRYGSLIKGVRAMRKVRASTGTAMFQTLVGGMGEMVDALVARLGGDLRRGVAVGSVRKVDGGFEVVAGEEVIGTDAVVMATPAYVTADLVADFAPDLSLLLRGIRYVSTATVSLAYRKEDVEGQHDFEGFGFLSPKHEGRRITACTWVSTKLDFRAPDDGVLVRTFVGGTGQEDLVDLDDEALIALSREELKDLMGLTVDPLFARVFRWKRGRPQFDVGHLERVAEMERLATQVGGLFLTGSAYRGSAIPDCVVQAVDTVDRILGEV